MQKSTTTTWKIDPGHSNLQFKIKHMGIAYIAGTFKVFDGQLICSGGDFSDASVTLEIDASSIDTNNKVRDEHLNGQLFFDTDQFPRIFFSGRLKKIDDDYKLTGDLTIRNITTPLELQTVLTGTGLGRWGDSRTGFELLGQLNRKESGLTFDVLTEAGGVIVGDIVKLQMDIELIKDNESSSSL